VAAANGGGGPAPTKTELAKLPPLTLERRIVEGSPNPGIHLFFAPNAAVAEDTQCVLETTGLASKVPTSKLDVERRTCACAC
jgi:hypothetical protein